MKRAITALALVGALLLSVVACQVYNPTNNETIYTAMRSEGPISWADYSKEFEEADYSGKYDIFKEYEAFRKLYKEQAKWEKLTVAYEKAVKAVEDAEKAVVDTEEARKEAEKVKAKAKKSMDKAKISAEKADATEKEKKAYKDAEAAYIEAEAAYTEAKAAADAAPGNLAKAQTAMKDAHKKVVYCTVEDLKALWDKEYDVRWDWNSKM